MEGNEEKINRPYPLGQKFIHANQIYNYICGTPSASVLISNEKFNFLKCNNQYSITMIRICADQCKGEDQACVRKDL